MVSPADGKVSDITEIAQRRAARRAGVRVGIFLSVFNVHVNRAPCDGEGAGSRLQEGQVHQRDEPRRGVERERSNTVVLGEPTAGQPDRGGEADRRPDRPADHLHAPIKATHVSRGERIGMIKFGSRTELYIPTWLEPQVKVKVGRDRPRRRGRDRGAGQAGRHGERASCDDEEFEPIVGRESPA